MDATALLQRLIRLNTVNPPGNERPAQELLAGLLTAAGFEVELVGRTPERPNLAARLRGKSDGPTLCLLSHVDTVYATPADWQRDPWSGDVHDGFLWGRGALDMKNQTAAEVSAATGLAQSGWRPEHGDLLVVSVADEETGGEEGAVWICENRPDLVRCDYLLNEGAGTVIPHDGRRVYGVCVAEKGVFRFRVIASGTAGHASTPQVGDNALVKLAPVIERLAGGRAGHDVTPGPQALLDGLGVGGIEELRAADPRLADTVEPMLAVTFAPTRVFASEKINVIPAEATLAVDCRVPPGHGRETAERRLREVLGDVLSSSNGDLRIEFFEEVVGNQSPVESPLMDAIRDWVAVEDPGAEVLPTILPGFTDSRTFRAAFPECVAYGWFPQRHQSFYDTWPLIHSADERIDVRDLEWATRSYADVTRRILG